MGRHAKTPLVIRRAREWLILHQHDPAKYPLSIRHIAAHVPCSPTLFYSREDPDIVAVMAEIERARAADQRRIGGGPEEAPGPNGGPEPAPDLFTPTSGDCRPSDACPTLAEHPPAIPVAVGSPTAIPGPEVGPASGRVTPRGGGRSEAGGNATAQRPPTLDELRERAAPDAEVRALPATVLAARIARHVNDAGWAMQSYLNQRRGVGRADREIAADAPLAHADLDRALSTIHAHQTSLRVLVGEYKRRIREAG